MGNSEHTCYPDLGVFKIPFSTKSCQVSLEKKLIPELDMKIISKVEMFLYYLSIREYLKQGQIGRTQEPICPLNKPDRK